MYPKRAEVEACEKITKKGEKRERKGHRKAPEKTSALQYVRCKAGTREGAQPSSLRGSEASRLLDSAGPNTRSV